MAVEADENFSLYFSVLDTKTELKEEAINKIYNELKKKMN